MYSVFIWSHFLFIVFKGVWYKSPCVYSTFTTDADESGQDPVEEGVSYEAANIHIITQCLVLMMCVQPAKLFNQAPIEL